VLSSTPTTAAGASRVSIVDNSVISVTEGDKSSRKKDRYNNEKYNFNTVIGGPLSNRTK